MTNFDYIKDREGVKHLYELCCEVECRQASDPGTSVLYARNVLDWIVQAIYRLEKIGDQRREHDAESALHQENRKHRSTQSE